MKSRRSLFADHRDRDCVCVDRFCPRGAANGGAVFPRVYSSFRCRARPCSRTCNLLRSSPRASLVWYFRSCVQGFFTPLKKRSAAEFMSAADPRFIVLPTPVAGKLFANPPESWRFFTVSGFDIAKGKRVDLTLVLKPE